MHSLTLAVSPTGAGWTSPAVGSYAYEHGASVTIEAYPNIGYEFDHWDVTFMQSGVTVPTSSWFDVVPMTEDIQATAYFNIVNHYLTISVSPAEGGSVTPESGEYQAGSLVLLTAYPNPGWSFGYWEVNGQIVSGNPIQVLVEADIQVIAHFSLGAEFEPGSSHTAKSMLSNPTGKAFDYEGYLYMGTGLAVVSYSPFHLDAGESKEIGFLVIMPADPGVYPVHLGVFSGGQNIGLYKAIEDVTIVAPAISDPNIKTIDLRYWTQDSAIPSDFLVGSKQTATLLFASYITETYRLEVILMSGGEVKASGSFTGYFYVKAGYSGININMVMPNEPGEYDTLIRTYRGGQLTGIYPVGKLTVYPITEPSYLSFGDLIYSLKMYPGLPGVGRYLDVECNIVNTAAKAITREVALWLDSYRTGAKYGSYWEVITRESHEAGGTNAGRVTFTLAPGATFNYHFAGQTVIHGRFCVELRDNMGGKSDYKCASW